MNDQYTNREYGREDDEISPHNIYHLNHEYSGFSRCTFVCLPVQIYVGGLGLVMLLVGIRLGVSKFKNKLFGVNDSGAV